MNFMIGYDCNDAADKALKLAFEYAKVFGAKLHVVTSLVGGPEMPKSLIGTPEAQKYEVNEAEANIETAMTLYRQEGVQTEKHILVRSHTPGEDIVQFADKNKIDLIFIGVKGRSRVGKLLFGSNAQYVILEAKCPVITVK